MQETKYSTVLNSQDSQISFHANGSNTNNTSRGSVKPFRQSSRRSKLPRHCKAECYGLPEWMLRRSPTISASSSSIEHSSSEIKELKVSLPLFYPSVKISASDVTAAQAALPTLPISIRIPITTTFKSEPVHYKIPDTIEIPAAADAPPGFYGDERNGGHSDLVCVCVSSNPVKKFDVKPVIHKKSSQVSNEFDSKPTPVLPNQTTFNPSSSNAILTTIKRPRGRPRIHPITVKDAALSGRSRSRGLTRRIVQVLNTKRQKIEDYPESVEQLEELKTLNANIQKTDGDIIRLKVLISEVVGKIKEQEAKNWKIGSTFVMDAWEKWLNLPNGKNGDMNAAGSNCI